MWWQNKTAWNDGGKSNTVSHTTKYSQNDFQREFCVGMCVCVREKGREKIFCTTIANSRQIKSISRTDDIEADAEANVNDSCKAALTFRKSFCTFGEFSECV